MIEGGCLEYSADVKGFVRPYLNPSDEFSETSRKSTIFRLVFIEIDRVIVLDVVYSCFYELVRQ